MTSAVDFVALPKIELHAHLSGSISRQCLHEIWLEQQQTQSHDAAVLALKDPLVEMPEGKFDYDLKTFFPLFSSYIYTLIRSTSALVYSTNSVLQDFATDGTVYLELRTTPRAIPSANLTPIDYIRTILSTIAASPTASTMTTKLILSIDRRNTAAQANAVVDIAIGLAPLGVVGLDLCGDPAVTANVASFTPAFQRAREAGLKLTVHFAEAGVSSSAEELAVLLGWGPERLGHFIHVPEAVKEVVRSRGLGLELCLSCNVHAGMLVGVDKGLVKGVADHHFGEWWPLRECPIIICSSSYRPNRLLHDHNKRAASKPPKTTHAPRKGDQRLTTVNQTDDVGVFGSKLSDEYRLVAVHFGLDRREICELARSGIDTIFGGEEEKERLRKVMWAV